MDLKTIKNVELIENNSKIEKVYLGFETSGKLHLGHYFLLRKLLSYSCEKIVYLANVHSWINKKNDFTKELIDWFSKVLPQVKIITGEEVFKDPKYWRCYLQMCSKLSMRNGLKGLITQMKKGKKEEDNLDCAINELNYTVFQTIDPHYFNVDLVIAGTDQRNIYMAGYDYYKSLGWTKPSYYFYPLISMNGDCSGEKMSKSKSSIPLDEKLYKTVQEALEGKKTFFDYFLTPLVLEITEKETKEEFLLELNLFLEPLNQK